MAETESSLTLERPRRRDAVLNRELLLDAASEVFATHGLDGTVEDVARAAGVGLGTLYRHFPTKDALINELVRELFADVVAAAEAALEQPEGEGFRSYLFAVGELQASRRGCLPRAWRASATPDHRRLVSAMQATTARLLADAQRHGRVRPDATLTDVQAIMFSLRGIIEVAGDVAPGMWRRHLDVVLAGLHPDAEPLAHKPVPKAVADRLPPQTRPLPRLSGPRPGPASRPAPGGA
jgi:AcrR family transcriptional regulator